MIVLVWSYMLLGQLYDCSYVVLSRYYNIRKCLLSAEEALHSHMASLAKTRYLFHFHVVELEVLT